VESTPKTRRGPIERYPPSSYLHCYSPPVPWGDEEPISKQKICFIFSRQGGFSPLFHHPRQWAEARCLAKRLFWDRLERGVFSFAASGCPHPSRAFAAVDFTRGSQTPPYIEPPGVLFTLHPSRDPARFRQGHSLCSAEEAGQAKREDACRREERFWTPARKTEERAVFRMTGVRERRTPLLSPRKRGENNAAVEDSAAAMTWGISRCRLRLQGFFRFSP